MVVRDLLVSHSQTYLHSVGGELVLVDHLQRKRHKIQ